jgi:hypothetical protein
LISRTTNGFNQKRLECFPDLIVTSFLNAKDGKLVAKRKRKDRTARKETGIRSARGDYQKTRIDTDKLSCHGGG